MGLKKIFFSCIFISLFFISPSQKRDTVLIQHLFQNLLNKQIISDSFFINGTYPSYRQFANNNHLNEDNNIFFSALIAFTLQELKPIMGEVEIIVVDTICNRIEKAYPFFKNKNGRDTYNFWPIINGEKTFFPNNALLAKRAKTLALPDDMDDTGLILSSLDKPDSVAIKTHFLMQPYVNGHFSYIKNTLKPYKKMEAYSTWFGEKMPIDFDFGVHCNTLYFVLKHKLPLSYYDSCTINLLALQIKNKHYLTKPNYISPYYYNTPNLLYHISRIMGKFKIDALEAFKPQLVQDLNFALSKETNFMNKIILSSALLKMGENPNEIEFKDNFLQEEVYNTNFVFYKGHLFAHLGNFIKSIASNLKATQFNWYSSAFNDCLILEYLLLRNSKLKH